MADRTDNNNPFIPTVDILETIVNKMDRTIEILSTAVNGSKTTLTVCRTYWVTQFSVYLIGGKKYRVTDLTNDSEIIVEPVGHSDPITATDRA